MEVVVFTTGSRSTNETREERASTVSVRHSVHPAVGVKEPARWSLLSSVISCSCFCSGLHTASQELVHTIEILPLPFVPNALCFVFSASHSIYSSLLVSHYHFFFYCRDFCTFFAFLLSLNLVSSYL